MERRMDDPDPFEPGTQTFSGTIKAWRKYSAEIVTDSGLSILFHVQQGQPPVPEGTRVTITARKYRPRYLMLSVTAA
jgi:hypothetical protein